MPPSTLILKVTMIAPKKTENINAIKVVESMLNSNFTIDEKCEHQTHNERTP